MCKEESFGLLQGDAGTSIGVLSDFKRMDPAKFLRYLHCVQYDDILQKSSVC